MKIYLIDRKRRIRIFETGEERVASVPRELVLSPTSDQVLVTKEEAEQQGWVGIPFELNTVTDIAVYRERVDSPDVQ